MYVSTYVLKSCYAPAGQPLTTLAKNVVAVTTQAIPMPNTHLACPSIQGCLMRSLKLLRWSAGFTSALLMYWTNPGLMNSGKLGGSWRMARIVSSRVDMPKGGRPTASSYASTPSAQLSTAGVYQRSLRSLLSEGRCLSGHTNTCECVLWQRGGRQWLRHVRLRMHAHECAADPCHIPPTPKH